MIIRDAQGGGVTNLQKKFGNGAEGAVFENQSDKMNIYEYLDLLRTL